MNKEERTAFLLKEAFEKEAIEKKLLDQRYSAPKIYFDLSYCDTMIFKELKSLISQINLCANLIKSFDLIYSLYLLSFTGKVKEDWERVGVSKQLQTTCESIEDIANDSFLENTIYLSPDAEETLSEFDIDNTNFIIGGIVDRSVTKNLTYDRAKELNIRCWKLPLFENLTTTTKWVLNINTVVEILLWYRNNGKNFKDAVEKAMPERHKYK